MKKIAAVMIFFAIFSCGKKDSASTEVISTVTAYEGTVLINGNPVKATGTAVHFGDLITTADKAFCDITFNEKNIIRLKDRSVLIFKISTVESILDLQDGWLSATMKKIASANGEVIIKTPTVTASIRGTSFCTKVENKDSTYFCVCNGKIELKDANGKTSDTVISAHHAGRTYTKEKDGSISINKNPGVLYHTDAGLEALSRKIGITVDWTKAD